MDDTIKCITKIEIKGLWNKFDVEWNLSPDVNILSGINGSGKSTILNSVYSLVNSNGLRNGTGNKIDDLGHLIQSCKIYFSDKIFVDFNFISRNSQLKPDENIGDNFRSIYFGPSFYIYLSENTQLFNRPDLLEIAVISTFDGELKQSEAIKKLSVDTVKTELDWEIYQLQTKYLSYQLNIGKRAFQAISNKDSNEDIIKIKKTQERFFEIIDTLFELTSKKIDRTKNEISFLLGDEVISPYQLSSGEKQILVILLTVLVQDNKNAILFLDEPEISLHFDWQKKLIQYIRELNPNVQLIMATHSPAMVIEGWTDKITEVSDITTEISKTVVHAGR